MKVQRPTILQDFIYVKTSKFVPVYFMKVYRVRLVMAPLILDLSIRLALRERGLFSIE
jgi:hypothetical protein